MADFQSYYILHILLCLATIIIIHAISTRKQIKPKLPASPPALPIIGHLHLLSPLPHQALHKLSDRYGPLLHLLFGSVSCVIVSSPEMAKEILKTQEASFCNRPQMAAVDYLSYGSAGFSFAPYGAYWKFMKKLCVSELLGSRTLDRLRFVRQHELKKLLQLMSNKANSNEAVDVGGVLMRVANSVISRMTMGRGCSESEEEADEVRNLVKEVAELAGTFNLSDYIWFCKNLNLQGLKGRLREVHARFDCMMENIIEEHEEARKGKIVREDDDRMKDLLDILLEISEDENSEMKLTRKNIKAFVLDIFAAGTDTSAITTEWALAELINHPSIIKKARKEIDSVIGTSKVVEESDIPNLPYLQAIVRETLRLHPSPLIVRESSESCTVAGFQIPAKTHVFVNVWAIGRDPNHWESPLEFKPERFLESEGNGKGQVDVRGQHFQLLPFGSGRRGCPGASLALQLVQTTLAAMIQCFEWRVGGDGTVDMEEGPGLTLPRAHPLICVPITRLDSFSRVLN